MTSVRLSSHKTSQISVCACPQHNARVPCLHVYSHAPRSVGPPAAAASRRGCHCAEYYRVQDFIGMLQQALAPTLMPPGTWGTSTRGNGPLRRPNFQKPHGGVGTVPVRSTYSPGDPCEWLEGIRSRRDDPYRSWNSHVADHSVFTLGYSSHAEAVYNNSTVLKVDLKVSTWVLPRTVAHT